MSTQCPYCKDRFSDDYYYSRHVPCPEPRGDGWEEKEVKKQSKKS